MIERGKFIVLYGANNLGKSTQVDCLVNNIRLFRPLKFVHKVKYPIYDLVPTGPIINSVLREGMQMEDFELQQTYAMNRLQFQPVLQSMLTNGINVIAEDYTMTGKAWGIIKGVSLRDLEEMNKDLIEPDLSIVLDGQRFTSGRENEHRHESDDLNWIRARESHLRLAVRYGYEIVNVNRNKEEISSEIWDIVRQII